MSWSSYNPQGPSECFPGYLSLPTGGKVFFVHNSGAAGLSELPAGMASPTPGTFETTLAVAVDKCRTGRGDKIVVLQGHTESVTADFLSALGTKTDIEIIGLGTDTHRPTLTWTLAGSTLLFDAAGFKLRNFNLFLAGAHGTGSALTVAAPITVSAASCAITDCHIRWGFDADQIVTIGIFVNGADFFDFSRNTCYAETAAVPTTTFMRITDSDFMRMYDTKIQGAGSTTTLGPVQFLTTASLALDWRRSVIQNQLASSIHAVTGMAGLTGTVMDCGLGILDNATAVGFVTPGNVQFIRTETSNDNGVGSATVPA